MSDEEGYVRVTIEKWSPSGGWRSEHTCRLALSGDSETGCLALALEECLHAVASYPAHTMARLITCHDDGFYSTDTSEEEALWKALVEAADRHAKWWEKDDA